MGFRQFQEGHGLVRLDRPVALDEVDTVPRLGQRQWLRRTLASPRDPAGSETLAMKLGLIKAELLVRDLKCAIGQAIEAIDGRSYARARIVLKEALDETPSPERKYKLR